jgi:hypothetical protein
VILTNKANTLFNQVPLYDFGNYTQIIQYYDKATQAVQYYDKALAIDPNYKDALNGKGSALDGIGNAFYNQGNYTQAIQYYNKALSINSTNTGTLFDKQNAITKIVESGNTSGFDRGCIDAQIPNPSERYINQLGKDANFHSDAFMQGYKSGFNSCFVQQSDSLPPSDTSSQIPSLQTMTDQDEETSFGIAIIIVILFVISSIALAIRKLTRRGKRRERQHFSDSVKQNILRKQDHKCAHCKRILNVVDWDHKNGNRPNNNESNCQALCPNCHAIKTRSARK